MKMLKTDSFTLQLIPFTTSLSYVSNSIAPFDLAALLGYR